MTQISRNRPHSPRAWRLLSLTALLGLSVTGMAHADTFTVAAGDVYGPNGLVAALNAANDQNAHPGPNTIVLAAGSVYTLTQRNNTLYGFTGLPIIANQITIEGNGAVIERSSAPNTPTFRLFAIAGPDDRDTNTNLPVSPGNLYLHNLWLRGGLARGGTGGGGDLFGNGGGGLGAGGAIYNRGALAVQMCTFSSNTARGGDGGFLIDRNPGDPYHGFGPDNSYDNYVGGTGGGGGGMGGNGGNSLTSGGGGGGFGGNGGMGNPTTFSYDVNHPSFGGGGGGTVGNGGDASQNANQPGTGGMFNGGVGGGALYNSGFGGYGGGGGGAIIDFLYGADGGVGGGGGGSAPSNLYIDFGGGGYGGFGGGGGGGSNQLGSVYGGLGGLGGFGGGGGAGGDDFQYSYTYNDQGYITAIIFDGYRDSIGAGGFGGAHGGYFGGGGMGAGGAIFNDGGRISLANSTLWGNTAAGGITAQPDSRAYESQHPEYPIIPLQFSLGAGGALFSRNGSVTIIGDTFSGNTAAGGLCTYLYQDPYDFNIFYTMPGPTGPGAGGALYLLGDGDPVYINGTVIDNGTAIDVRHDTVASPYYNAIYSIFANSVGAASDVFINSINGGAISPVLTAHNLVQTNGTGSNGLGGAALSADPLLGPLQYNGGLTPTLAPAYNSPVIDAASETYAPVIDQRGVARPQGAGPDIGAVEFQAAQRLIITGITASRITSGVVNVTLVVQNAGNVPLANIKVTSARLRTLSPASVPAPFTLAPGATRGMTLLFSASAPGIAAGYTPFIFNGSYTGGTFSTGVNIAVP